MANPKYLRIEQLGWRTDVLKNARVLVVGAGALGNEVLKNLALLGVGKIIIVDMDIIEDHNLTRSVLFRHSDVGKAKSTVAALRAEEINPDIQVIDFVGRIQNVFGLGAYRHFDIVFGCLDNAQARYDVNKACWQMGTLFIDAGLDKINGDVRVFHSLAENTACFSCTISEEDRKNLEERHRCLQLKIVENEQIVPTAPTVSSLIAGWQTQLGVKYLHNLNYSPGYRIGLYGDKDDVFKYKISLNHQCVESGDHFVIPADRIMESPFSTEEDTPAKLLLFTAEKYKNLSNYLVLDLGFDFVSSAMCTNCGNTFIMNRRKEDIFVKEVTCCNTIMELEETYLIHLNDDLAGKKFSELGVAPFDVLTIKDTHSLNPDDWKYFYLSLSGDAPKILCRSN